MQLERALAILNHLNIGPETVTSLHQKLIRDGFKVSQRSVYRDLVVLEKSFKAGRFRLNRYVGEFNKSTWMLVSPASGNNREDLFFQSYTTEFLKPSWLRSLSGNLLEDIFGQGVDETVASDIRQWLPSDAMCHSGWGEFEYNREHYNRLKDLLWAITNKRVLLISFYDHISTVQRRFRPLKVVYHRGTLHIVGWLFEEAGPVLRIQEMDTIQIQRLTNDRYHSEGESEVVSRLLKQRFGIHDTLDETVHRVVLEMGEGPAIFLKNRRWHADQVFQRKGDHWTMEFRSTINIELIGWIMSWMEHVRVLEPESLIRVIREKADYVSSMYSDNRSAVAPSDTDDPYSVGR